MLYGTRTAVKMLLLDANKEKEWLGALLPDGLNCTDKVMLTSPHTTLFFPLSLELAGVIDILPGV